jgi:uncharacterized OsmC-like protein
MLTVAARLTMMLPWAGAAHGERPMDETRKTDLVTSRSTGVRGRALNSARMHHFVVDSQAGPGEALFPAEVFLSGVSACAVHLVERFADEHGVPLQHADVEIEGLRLTTDPTRFQRVEMRFVLQGPSQEQAEELVQAYQGR